MPMTNQFDSLKALALCCLLALWCVPSAGQTGATTLLAPFNQVEFESAKREKALVATQEYQAKEQELKDNTALPNAERQKQRTANYYAYLKKMEGLLNKEQREKARTMLVENDVRALRQKPALPRYYDQLGLSEEQAAKAKDLNLQQRIKTQTVYHTGSFSPESRAEENKYINEEFTKKFNDLLTPEQRTKLADVRKQASVLAAIPVPPMYQKLGLNAAQTDKLKLILLERQTKLDALSKDQSLTLETRQPQINALNLEADKNAQALLNKEQKLKLEDLLREANYKMPPFYAQLDLTTEQQAKLKEAILWQAHEAAVLKQDTTLSTEQRQQRLDQIGEELQIRFNAFMTPEQQTKFKTLLREMQQKSQTQKPPEQFD